MISGQKGEELACQYLQERGLILIAKNFRVPWGEIDLIMQDGDVCVFVEVRFRSSESHGTALETVTVQKQRKIKRTAAVFLARQVVLPVARFDVVGIRPRGTKFKIEWVKGAFE